MKRMQMMGDVMRGGRARLKWLNFTGNLAQDIRDIAAAEEEIRRQRARNESALQQLTAWGRGSGRVGGGGGGGSGEGDGLRSTGQTDGGESTEGPLGRAEAAAELPSLQEEPQPQQQQRLVVVAGVPLLTPRNRSGPGAADYAGGSASSPTAQQSPNAVAAASPRVPRLALGSVGAGSSSAQAAAGALSARAAALQQTAAGALSGRSYRAAGVGDDGGGRGGRGGAIEGASVLASGRASYRQQGSGAEGPSELLGMYLSLTARAASAATAAADSSSSGPSKPGAPPVQEPAAAKMQPGLRAGSSSSKGIKGGRRRIQSANHQQVAIRGVRRKPAAVAASAAAAAQAASPAAKPQQQPRLAYSTAVTSGGTGLHRSR